VVLVFHGLSECRSIWSQESTVAANRLIGEVNEMKKVVVSQGYNQHEIKFWFTLKIDYG
jgi:hypothetical protein